MTTQFPIFRKLPNGRAFYKIFSEQKFEELKIMGIKYTLGFYTATQHPERVFIQDIMFTGLDIAESEYDFIVDDCIRNLIQVNF